MAAKPNKTQATVVSVPDYLGAIEPAGRREDSFILCALMSRLSGEPARMWGPSMVGFGVRRYRYDSGREGEIFKVGFAPRKPAMVLYVAGAASDPLAAELGTFTHGKSCIYVKRISDIDLSVLETLIAATLNADRPGATAAPD